MPPKQIFLSHSDLDRQFAMQLAHMLNRYGIAVWYSRTEIIGAQQWIDAIGSALNRCDWFIVILSPNSVSSIFSQQWPKIWSN